MQAQDKPFPPSAAPKLGTPTRLLRACGLTIAVLVGVAYYMWIKRNINPTLHHDPPKLPTPNAATLYIGAAEKTVAPDRIAALRVASPTASRAEREREIAANAGALELTREGTRAAFVEPYKPPIEQPIHDLQDYMLVGALLQLESIDALDRGDAAHAADDAADILILGQQISNGGTLESVTGSQALTQIGADQVRRLLDRLNDRDLRTLVGRLERAEAERSSFDQILEIDKWYGQAAILKTFRTQPWRGRPEDLFSNDKDLHRPWSRQVLDRLHLLNLNKTEMLRQYTDYFDSWQAGVRDHRSALTPFAEPPVPIEPVLRRQIPPIGDFWQQDIITRSMLARLIVDVGAALYKKERGTPPRSTAALVPGYLISLPIDPLSPDGTPRIDPTTE